MSEQIESYAGIGSRDISVIESNVITELARMLSERYVLYSGNAKGADSYFQKGSGGKCVIFLPYSNFNVPNAVFDINTAQGLFIAGNTNLGNEWTDKVHPAANRLKDTTRPYLNRNAHQIFGWYDQWPKVNFVLCCADTDRYGKVMGGTGHACRIAKATHTPIYNIREYLKTYNSTDAVKILFEKIKSDEDRRKLALAKFENQMMTTGLLGIKSKKDDPNIWMELN